MTLACRLTVNSERILSNQLAVLEDEQIACTRCKQRKLRIAFGADARRATGLQAWCKSCRKEYTAEKAEDNRARAAKWRLENLNAAKAARKERYWLDADAARQAAKDYRNDHPGRDRERWACERRELGDWYMASLMGTRKSACPPELLAMKREQIATLRLARQLKKATRESSKDTDRIPGEHGSSCDSGRSSPDRGEQPSGAGAKGNQRHGRGSDGQGPGLDQQQLER